MQTIIGLHGNTGSGKDTVAKRMENQHDFRVLAFADSLKVELVETFNVFPVVFSDRQLKVAATEDLCLSHCTSKEFLDWYLSTADGELEIAHQGACIYSLPRSPRWLMQKYGDFRRASNADYWINRVEEKIADLPGDVNVVVSDVRMGNEYGFIKAYSNVSEVWEIIRMNNPHHNKNDRHSSNTRLPSVDKVLFNSGTINQLWRKVDRAVEKVL